MNSEYLLALVLALELAPALALELALAAVFPSSSFGADELIVDLLLASLSMGSNASDVSTMFLQLVSREYQIDTSIALINYRRIL